MQCCPFMHVNGRTCLSLAVTRLLPAAWLQTNEIDEDSHTSISVLMSSFVYHLFSSGHWAACNLGHDGSPQAASAAEKCEIAGIPAQPGREK